MLPSRVLVSFIMIRLGYNYLVDTLKFEQIIAIPFRLYPNNMWYVSMST